MAKVSKNNKGEVEYKQFDVASDRFVSGEGIFNYSRMLESIDNDERLTGHEKRVMKKRLRKVSDSIGNANIGVERGQEGNLTWHWKDAMLDEERKAGVIDEARKGFGGKGFMGLQGQGYDRLLDYMVAKGGVDFTGLVTKEEPQGQSDENLEPEEDKYGTGNYDVNTGKPKEDEKGEKSQEQEDSNPGQERSRKGNGFSNGARTNAPNVKVNEEKIEKGEHEGIGTKSIQKPIYDTGLEEVWSAMGKIDGFLKDKSAEIYRSNQFGVVHKMGDEYYVGNKRLTGKPTDLSENLRYLSNYSIKKPMWGDEVDEEGYSYRVGSDGNIYRKLWKDGRMGPKEVVRPEDYKELKGTGRIGKALFVDRKNPELRTVTPSRPSTKDILQKGIGVIDNTSQHHKSNRSKQFEKEKSKAQSKNVIPDEPLIYRFPRDPRERGPRLIYKHGGKFTQVRPLKGGSGMFKDGGKIRKYWLGAALNLVGQGAQIYAEHKKSDNPQTANQSQGIPTGNESGNIFQSNGIGLSENELSLIAEKIALKLGGQGFQEGGKFFSENSFWQIGEPQYSAPKTENYIIDPNQKGGLGTTVDPAIGSMISLGGDNTAKLQGGTNSVGDLYGGSKGSAFAQMAKSINFGDLIQIFGSKPISVDAPKRPLLKATVIAQPKVEGLSFDDEARMRKNVVETNYIDTKSANPSIQAAVAKAKADQSRKVSDSFNQANAQVYGQNKHIAQNISMRNQLARTETDNRNAGINYQNKFQEAQGNLQEKLARQKWVRDSAQRIFNRGEMVENLSGPEQSLVDEISVLNKRWIAAEGNPQLQSEIQSEINMKQKQVEEFQVNNDTYGSLYNLFKTYK